MPVPRPSLLLAALLSFAAAWPATGDAQVGGLLKRGEEAAKKRVEEAARKVAAEKGKSIPDSVRAAAEPGAAATQVSPAARTGGGKAASKQDASVWENYDFVPGGRILFYTDFSEDRVGNFASRLRYGSGPIEVVERGGSKVLRATGKSEFLIPLGTRLPDRFTLEIDVIAPAEPCCLYGLVFFEGGGEMDRGDNSADVSWAPHGGAILGGGQNLANSSVRIPESLQPALRGNVAHVRVLMDGTYFKMYSNERRLYNIPSLAFKRDSLIRVLVEGSEEAGMAVFLTAIRVAESNTDVLYDALAASGRWATQGILFATGKADLQPESRPVLKEIAQALVQHPELRILIEGHTDNVGPAAANLALSDARAAAVKAALVAEFSLGADRITTKGFGDSRPAVPNTTAEGRMQNRRVEVVKQ